MRDADYHTLLMFRCALRHYLRWSADQAAQVGLTPQQHQLMLAVRGHRGTRAPSVRDVAGYLLIRHHSAGELAARADQLGLLNRWTDDVDHRVVRLRLTARGERLLRTLAQTHHAELQRVAARLGISAAELGRLSATFVEQLAIEVNRSATSG